MASKKKSEDETSLGGIAKAIKSICDSTNRILSGNDATSDYLIEGEENKPFSMETCANSPLASLVYVMRSNSAYSSHAWKLVRKEITPAERRGSITHAGRCGETGLQVKLPRFYSSTMANSPSHVGASIERSMNCASHFLLVANGFPTNAAEGSFSTARMSGLILHLPKLWLKPILVLLSRLFSSVMFGLSSGRSLCGNALRKHGISNCFQRSGA